MTKNATLKEQIRRNAVALISLSIAVTSLAYNTWRNEASEHNRNQRLVAIELLQIMSDMRQLALDTHYGDNVDGPALLRKGWAKVLTIRDLAQIAEGSVPETAMILFDVWQQDSKNLDSDIEAKDRIIAALEQVRLDTHDVLRNLD
jgi:hypothetical protein